MPSPGSDPRTETGPQAVTLTEALLDQFAAASRTPAFDEKLFDIAAGGNLAQRLEALVAAVQEADIVPVIQAQRPLAALFGEDLEARMTFALARKRAHAAMKQASTAAMQTGHLITLLEQAHATLQAESRRLTEVSSLGTGLLSRLAPATTLEALELRSRFERRLANLNALCAATALTVARIPQAIAHNRQILDRFNDMNTLLFPVWERHALTIVQSPADAHLLEIALAEAVQSLGARLLAHVGAAA